MSLPNAQGRPIRWVERTSDGSVQDSRISDSARMERARKQSKEANLLRAALELDSSTFSLPPSKTRRRRAPANIGPRGAVTQPTSVTPVAVTSVKETRKPTKAMAVVIPDIVSCGGNPGSENEDSEMEDVRHEQISESETDLARRVGELESDLARMRVFAAEKALQAGPASSSTPSSRISLANRPAPQSRPVRFLPPVTPSQVPATSFPGAHARPAWKLELQENVRAFCAEQLGIKRVTGPSGVLIETAYPAEPNDAKVTWQTKEDLTNKTFTYAWSQPPGHLFNRRAVELLTEAMLENYQLEQEHSPTVRDAIMVHLEGLRGKWKRQQSPQSIETTVAKRIVNSNKSRCDRLLKANLKIIGETPELEHLLSVWVKLGTSGTSTDEESGTQEGAPVYSILKKEWRSAELEFFCRFLSAYLITCKKSRRIRRPSKKVSTRPAPPGLPENWYKPSFLEGLLPAQLSELKVAPAQSLDIPHDLLKACGLVGEAPGDTGVSA